MSKLNSTQQSCSFCRKSSCAAGVRCLLPNQTRKRKSTSRCCIGVSFSMGKSCSAATRSSRTIEDRLAVLESKQPNFDGSLTNLLSRRGSVGSERGVASGTDVFGLFPRNFRLIEFSMACHASKEKAQPRRHKWTEWQQKNGVFTLAVRPAVRNHSNCRWFLPTVAGAGAVGSDKPIVIIHFGNHFKTQREKCGDCPRNQVGNSRICAIVYIEPAMWPSDV